jgi:hypothetical protein
MPHILAITDVQAYMVADNPVKLNKGTEYCIFINTG